MNDLEYRYFFEVARTLSFSQAAERLYLSQSALSRCIAKLEKEFQAPLFIRDKHNIHLTNAGETLLKHYPKVQEADRILHTLVCDAAQGIDSRLTIGIQEGHLISPSFKKLVRTFQRLHPNIKIETVSLLYNELFDQLSNHQVDVAFALDFPCNTYSGLEEMVFERRSSYALVSVDHPAAKCGTVEEALACLNGMDLMMVGWTIVPNVTSFIFNQCTANGIRPANIRYAPSYLTLYSWLCMDKGFVIMNKNVVFHETDICYIPLLQENEINACIYWNQDIANPAVSCFAEYLSAGENGQGETDHGEA